MLTMLDDQDGDKTYTDGRRLRLGTTTKVSDNFFNDMIAGITTLTVLSRWGVLTKWSASMRSCNRVK